MDTDDLWSDPMDELSEPEASSKPIVPTVRRPTGPDDVVITPKYSRPSLKKIVLRKVAEPGSASAHIPGQVDCNPRAPFQAVANANSNRQLNQGVSYKLLPASGLLKEPQALQTAPAKFDDLWRDDSEQILDTESPGVEEAVPSRLPAEAYDGLLADMDAPSPVKEIAEEGRGTQLEADFWTISDNLRTWEEEAELADAWSDDERSFTPKSNELASTGALWASDFGNTTTDLLTEFEDENSLQRFEKAIETSSLLDGLEFIDIKAELAALEQKEEEELAVQQPGVEHEDEIGSGLGRGRAPGWWGSSSVLYIDWEDEEKAEQEALERLGYSKLRISEATRAFVIQAARACKLTFRRERLLTTQLADARMRLAQLPDHEDYAQQRNQLSAEIAELERTLVYYLQWVAVKKAPRFLGQGIELDDLIQYGLLGVLAGVRHFDVRRGTRLLAAVNWWVFQALVRAATEHASLIRLPVYIHESLANIKKKRTELELILGRSPTHGALSSALHISTKRLEGLLSLPTTISLDQCVRVEHVQDGYSFQPLEECLVISEEDCLYSTIDRDILKQDVDTVLSCLTLRERNVIRLRYGLNDEEGCMHTLEEVGRKIHVTRERVRQIEERAFEKIRRRYGMPGSGKKPRNWSCPKLEKRTESQQTRLMVAEQHRKDEKNAN